MGASRETLGNPLFTPRCPQTPWGCNLFNGCWGPQATLQQGDPQGTCGHRGVKRGFPRVSREAPKHRRNQAASKWFKMYFNGVWGGPGNFAGCPPRRNLLACKSVLTKMGPPARRPPRSPRGAFWSGGGKLLFAPPMPADLLGVQPVQGLLGAPRGEGPPQ